MTATAVCAHLTGLPIQPCFRVQRIDYHTFRGSISGLGFAYCDFHQRNARAALTKREPARAPATVRRAGDGARDHAADAVTLERFPITLIGKRSSFISLVAFSSENRRPLFRKML